MILLCTHKLNEKQSIFTFGTGAELSGLTGMLMCQCLWIRILRKQRARQRRRRAVMRRGGRGGRARLAWRPVRLAGRLIRQRRPPAPRPRSCKNSSRSDSPAHRSRYSILHLLCSTGRSLRYLDYIVTNLVVRVMV